MILSSLIKKIVIIWELKYKMKKNPHSPNEIGDYILGIIKHNAGTKKLGEGTFSKVKLGTHKITNENVAIKIL